MSDDEEPVMLGMDDLEAKQIAESYEEQDQARTEVMAGGYIRKRITSDDWVNVSDAAKENSK